MQSSTIHEDKQLFARISDGDSAAFNIIFHRYNSLLFHSVLKLLKSEAEAEEVMQEVFLKTWIKKEELPAVENPGGWLYTMASNLSLSMLRSKARKNIQFTDLSQVAEEGTEDIKTDLYTRELRTLVEEAVNKLPESRKKIFLLTVQHGKKRQEIAKELGISEHTVKNQLVSARKFIQHYLEKSTGIFLPPILISLLSKFF